MKKLIFILMLAACGDDTVQAPIDATCGMDNDDCCQMGDEAAVTACFNAKVPNGSAGTCFTVVCQAPDCSFTRYAACGSN